MGHIIVCITSYYKGADFIKQCKAQGNIVYLVTSKSLEHDPWPWEAIDEVFYMNDPVQYQWNMDDLLLGMAHLMRSKKIEKVVALDDFDVEKAALVRETFRIRGMGQTTQRYFRDKLAMRKKAADHNINIPAFTAVFNDDDVNSYADSVSPPWVLKPRSEASATGIKKIHSKDELWQKLHSLGNERHLFLLEQFRPGDVYHVDTIIFDKKTVFTSASKYLATPMEVSHHGGVFRTMTLSEKDPDYKALKKANDELLKSFGLVSGASHSEFIKCHDDGKWYFLETSARVGGAFISDMVEAATGVNLWREWAKVENALLEKKQYQAPKSTQNFGGLLVSLAKDKHPDTSMFTDKELVMRLPKEYHVGLVFKSNSSERIKELLDHYAKVVTERFLNILPPTDKPTN